MKTYFKSILVLAFSLNYLICYPGFLTADSYMQYRESINLDLSNHHPPILAIIWHYLNFIYQGSQMILALNLAMIWLSIGLLTICFYDKYPKACWFMLLVPFTPAILGNSAIIWKDVFLGNAVLLSISLSIYSHYHQRNRTMKFLTFIFAALVLFVGASVKFQGKFIVPLILFLMICLVKNGFRYKKASAMLAILISFLFYMANSAINTAFNVVDTKSEQLRQFFDIAGISICADTDMMPEYVKQDPRYSFAKIKSLYLPAFVNPYIGSSKNAIYTPTLDENKLNALQMTFLKSAFSHPWCYTKHRLGTFLRMERGGSFTFQNCHDLSIPLSAETSELCDFKGNFYVEVVEKYISAFNFLSRNYIFLLINLAFLICGTLVYKELKTEQQFDIGISLYISATCILFTLVMFFTTMAADHRYLYLVRLLTFVFFPLQISLLWKLYSKQFKVYSSRFKNWVRQLQGFAIRHV